MLLVLTNSLIIKNRYIGSIIIWFKKSILFQSFNDKRVDEYNI